MENHQKLLEQLKQTTEDCKKINDIQKLNGELKEICDFLEKDKNTLLIKYKNEAFLNSEEIETIEINSTKYATVIKKLQELLIKIN